MSLGNPLPGRNQAKDETWQGTPIFRVTSTFAEHVASGRGPGIDFGNGRAGDPVMACEAGVVQTFQDPNGALVVRVRHSPSLFTGYAHLSVFTVVTGETVYRGQQVGTVGSTGADAAHLHWGVNQNGVEIDGWPLLDQNILGDDMTLKGRAIQPMTESSKRLATTIISPGGANVVRDPTAQPYDVVGNLAAGKTVQVDWQVKANLIGGSDIWYGFWWWSNPPEFTYVPAVNCGPLVATGGDPTAAFNDGVAAAAAKAQEARK